MLGQSLRISKLVLIACALLAATQLRAAPFAPTRFTVAVEGAGQDVIMIPGLASSREVWRTEAGRLKGKYRLHLVQVLGFAGTDKGANAQDPIILSIVDELANYIDANKLQHVAVIGHSMGGLIGLQLANKHPKSVAKVLIVDSLPFYALIFGPNVTADLIKPQATAMRDMQMKSTPAQFEASERIAMARLIKSKNAEAEKAIAAAVASDREVVARATYEDLLMDVRGDLPAIKTPIVVLYPYDSAMGIPQANVDRLYESAYAELPNKRIVRVENSFHFIQIDQPEKFHDEVMAFLTKALFVSEFPFPARQEQRNANSEK